MTLDTTGLASCFLGEQSGDTFFTHVLAKIRKLLHQSKQLRIFTIIDEGFTKKLSEEDHAVYWKEIQDILRSRNCTIERLEKMKKTLEDKKAFLKNANKFSDKNPQNAESKQVCVTLDKECQMLEQQLLEAVESVIASKDYADIGCYFKAELIQSRSPVEAHQLLSKIPEDSGYYLKANNLMAHILMDNTVFSQIFHPEFEEGKELEGEEAEQFTIEKLKKIIHHLRLAKIEGEEKRLFGQLLTELVTGESSLGQETPFDKMPLEPGAAVDFLLDMLREQHSRIKVLESALQSEGVSMPVEEAPRQNVLRFYPTLQRKKDQSTEQKQKLEAELPSNNEHSKLTNSQ